MALYGHDFFTGDELDDILAEYDIIESDDEVETEDGCHEFFDSIEDEFLLQTSVINHHGEVEKENVPPVASEVPAHVCPHCRKSYKSEPWLKKHIANVHKQENAGSSKKPERFSAEGGLKKLEWIYLKALREVEEDKIFSKSNRGREAVSKAKELRERMSEPQYGAVVATYLSSLNSRLFKTVSSGDNLKLSSNTRMIIFREFHQMRLSPDVFHDFRHFVQELGLPCTNDPLLFQKHLSLVFQHYMIERESIQVSQPTPQIFSLTDQEEETLRYVSGYVPYALLRQFARGSGELHKTCAQVVSSWNTTSNPCASLEHTRAWINQVDRGGLFIVSDQVYLFFRQVELVVRSIFNRDLLKSYQGEAIASVIFQRLLASETVKRAWCSITSQVESDGTSFYLFKCTMRKYVAIRGNSFARSWKKQLDVLFSKQVSRKGEKSLRGTLKK